MTPDGKRPVVSMIPYANMAPYGCLGEPPGCDRVALVPSASVEALQTGRIVAAAVPVGALPRLEEIVEMLGNFGIGAEGKVDSVMLFSKVPLNELSAPRTICLTDQSATSVRLACLLIGYAVGFDRLPYLVDTEEEADAVLLIGDEALIRKKAAADAHIVDLAAEWQAVHGLPFVFARWVVRKDAPAELKRNLLGWLSGLADNEAAYIAETAPAEALRVGLSEAEMADYLKGIRRVLTDTDLAGQERFLLELKNTLNGRWFPRKEPLIEMNRRADLDTALHLLTKMPLGELSARAHRARIRRHPSPIVTYVMDTNPNYTNICSVKCRFCAFCKSEGDPKAFTLTPDALAERVRAACEKGASTVLLQGGHNKKVRLQDWLAYIRAAKSACPDVHVHPFSPPEILDMAQKENLSVEAVLAALRAEGIDTLPGGGAEILQDDIRKRIAPNKCSATEWLDVMAAAHGAGMRTTATMMFGHVESDRDIALHLLALRAVQDRTGGFRSFIPWSFKPGNSPLTDEVPRPAHPARYIRIIAAARLILDNFDHIQSSWFSESERAGMLGLIAGADDFGGVLVEENVLKTSGYERRTTEERVREIIRRAGFVPARRDSHYRVIEVFDTAPESAAR